MRPILWVIFFGLGFLPSVSEATSSKYQSGTIMSVKAHDASKGEAASDRLYDISVKVGNTIYVVLYNQPPGTINPEYRTGLSLLVLVKGHTLKFNDLLGRPQELPILSQRKIPETNGRSEGSPYSLLARGELPLSKVAENLARGFLSNFMV